MSEPPQLQLRLSTPLATTILSPSASNPPACPLESLRQPVNGRCYWTEKQDRLGEPAAMPFDVVSPARYHAGQSGSPESHPNQQNMTSRTFEDSEIFADDLAEQISEISRRATNVRGGSCDLYTGRHKTEGKVALKRPRISEDDYESATVRRFLREAKTWKDLQHPNILRFLGACKIDSVIYLVSPFMKNGTIMDFIAKDPLKADRVQLIREIASALEYLHARNIIHGDLKGSNILMSDDADPVVCDFGLSRIQDAKTSTKMKGAGTVRWQAPEIWEDAPKSFKTDVYALAMTIVEVVSGDVPFRQYTADMAVVVAVLIRNERPTRELLRSSDRVTDEWLWDIVSVCWDKNPKKRPCMSEVTRLLGGQPASSARVMPRCAPLSLRTPRGAWGQGRPGPPVRGIKPTRD